MKKIIVSGVFVLLSIMTMQVSAQTQPASILAKKLQSGDIAFQYIPCGDLCIAIAEVTPCAPGRPFNHCGIVAKDGDSISIIEAIGRDVHATPLSLFLKRDTTSVLFVGRPVKSAGIKTEEVLLRARSLEGRPYDHLFLPGDSALYCSELVYEAYRVNGQPAFTLLPMTFKSPSTGNTFPAWADYYKGLGQDIPEGIPGINPCALANAPNIKLMSFEKR